MLCFQFQDYVGDTIVESGDTYVVINSEHPQESYVHQVAYRTEEGAPTGSCYIFRDQQPALLCAAALTGTPLYYYGPRRDKTCLQGFQQSELQTSVLSYRD